MHISCTDLVRVFSGAGVEVQALQGLNLQVRAGEMVAIVGASGSGKSTLLTILSGLDTPTAGAASVAGHDLLRMKRRERIEFQRHSVGFVWQQTARNLLPYLSTAQNINAPLALARTAKAERARRVDDLLALLHLGDEADRMPAELSGGQQQRAAIAVAIANDPKVLLADEPTGDLDEATTEEVLSALQLVNDERGITTLIVTHDPTVASHVRRTIQIRDGRTSSEVLRSTRRGTAGDEVIAQEYAVLDRVGRLQLPRRFTESLSLADTVRLELEPDHVRIWPGDSEPRDPDPRDPDPADPDPRDSDPTHPDPRDPHPAHIHPTDPATPTPPVPDAPTDPGANR
ncbi:ABC transporter ATP-binding protein [Subtercola sp. YIM 133946]